MITGFAGFIGFHAARESLRRGWEVVGIDNFNDYYSVKLKRDRAAVLEALPGFSARELDICDLDGLRGAFAAEAPDVVLNLAAQPGVRYCIDHPFVYQKTNIEGFLNVLECCRHAAKIPKLVFASSSSVYGAWYRPDMALSLFADAMLHDKPIKVFNHGDMLRDFTYVDDIVDGIVRVVESDALPAYDIFNIGNHRSEKLLDVINVLSESLGVEPKMEMLPMQPGDVYATYASVDKLNKAVGYEPKTTIREGIPVFAQWYKDYHGL